MDGAAVPRGRNEAHLRHLFLPDLAEFIRGPRPAGFPRYGLERRIAFSAWGDSSPALPRSAARIRTTGMPLSIRSPPTCDAVQVRSGRKQRAARGSARQKVDRVSLPHFRYTIDTSVTLVFHRPMGRRDMRDGDASGVEHVDAHRRGFARDADRPCSIDQGPDACEDVAAVWSHSLPLWSTTT